MLILYRSGRDTRQLPNTLYHNYISYALNCEDQSIGHKFAVTPTEKITMIQSLLIAGLIIVNSRHIHNVPNNDLIKLPRASHNGKSKQNKLIIIHTT